MSNPSQTDEWILSTLRDVETPAVPAHLTGKLLRPRSRFRLGPWLAASGVASLGALLVVVEILQPTTSLAQVARAQARQTQYTLVNTRLLGEGTEYRVTECRDGSRWCVHAKTLKIVDTVAEEPKQFIAGVYGSTVMDGTRTVHLRKLPGFINVVEIDDPKPREDRYEFDVDKILRRNPGVVMSTNGIEWHGHRVDRFEVHSSYVSQGKIRTVDQIVLADASTHLPLRVEELRDGKSWGDAWDYDYGRPSEDHFKLDIDPTTTVFDLRKERAELKKDLKQGAVFVEYGRDAEVLLPVTSTPIQPIFPVKFTASSVRMQADLVVRTSHGKPDPYLYAINGKRWYTMKLVWPPFNDFGSFSLFKNGRVSMKLGDYRLTNVPVYHVDETRSLLRPFSIGLFRP